MPKEEKAVRIRAHGNVQGVFYRASARNQARELGLVGFVRNEPDGTVYIEAQGGESAIREFVNWCKEGSSAANVQRVETEDMEPKKLNRFAIRQ